MSLAVAVCAAAAALAGCSAKNTAAADAEGAEIVPLAAPVTACADSIMAYARVQTDFGPRTPGSAAHQACRSWLASKLSSLDVENVEFQIGTATTSDGVERPLYNITGQINPAASHRVLLTAHYDTRPWADEEAEEANRGKAIDGANDGASGVAVILEIARAVQQVPLDSVGVDILLVDLEDSGESGSAGGELTWCLGSQYWAENTDYAPGTAPRYGILLDMVGGRDARFHREAFSQNMAKGVVDRIWAMAAASGYADRFPNEAGGSVVDDHIFISRAGIPTADIIESANPLTGTFNPSWHTLDDNIDNLDPATMQIVAQVVLNLLYLNP